MAICLPGLDLAPAMSGLPQTTSSINLGSTFAFSMAAFRADHSQVDTIQVLKGTQEVAYGCSHCTYDYDFVHM
jgi:hypothetical protein